MRPAMPDTPTTHTRLTHPAYPTSGLPHARPNPRPDNPTLSTRRPGALPPPCDALLRRSTSDYALPAPDTLPDPLSAGRCRVKTCIFTLVLLFVDRS
jgi:hypothetical protein